MFGRMHLNRQAVLSICLVHLVAVSLTTAILVANAREAVRLEIDASANSARALVLSSLGYALRQSSPADVLPRLAEILVAPRHVDITLLDARLGVLPLRQLSRTDEPGAAPDWFVRLATPGPRETRIPIETNGRLHGYVSMTAAPGDEIAEVWHDVASMIWIVAGTAMVSALIVTMLVNRTLRPLETLRTALAQLRQGQHSVRVGRGASADLVPIFEDFDALSEALETAEADRVRLNRRIVELGDAERRTLAMELHDEFGPCLFGLKVKSSAIARAAEANNDRDLAQDASSIQSIVAQIQASNSRLLTTLRPMAIGQLPLIDALLDLFAAFRKTHPDVDWRVDVPQDLPETPEIVDLTVYRFFQEGVTNALRHGKPARITVSLSRQETEGGATLQLGVEDDGLGMADERNEGRGLTAMRDRIRTVGGSLTIDATEAGGTRLTSRLPMLMSSDRPEGLRAVS
ncbi:ATP-binding protein [Roseibium sp.]|uniref:ATP-binding protein n=1 Tax=Roseibium sp. TaxID=1936156 RepID=UPI0032677DA7